MSNHRYLHLKKVVLLFIGFALFFTDHRIVAKDSDGFWRLIELQIRGDDNDTREGARRAYMTGGAGAATYNSETEYDENLVLFRAIGQYTQPPQVLIPGKSIELPYSLSKTQFERPGSWGTVPGARISINDTRPHSDPDRRPFGTNYGMLAVSGVGDTAPKSDIAEIVPPVYQTGDEAYYVLTFFIGSSSAHRYFDYLYEWVPGAPTDEELAESVVNDTPATPEVSTAESGALVSFSRGDVMVKIQGIWYDADSGITLPPGAVLKTGENGIAEVALATGTMIRLRPGSTLEVPEVDELEETGGIISMLIGRIWIRAQRGTPFSVQTSSAIAGVRGTDFAVEMDDNGRETFICYSGEIEVTPVDDSGNPVHNRGVSLGGGEKIVVSPSGEWTEKTRISEIDQSVGLVLGSESFSESSVLSVERAGRLFTDRESGEWRLKIYEQQGNVMHGILLFEGLVVRDVSGSRLTSPFGTLQYHGSYSESSDSGWLIVEDESSLEPFTGEDLGYSIIVPEGGRNAVEIMRHGELAWSLTQFMVFPEFDMVDQTGNGIPNVLIRYARGRSFRGFILLELGLDGVTELWGFQVHASEAFEVEDEIERRRVEGESLEKSPQVSRYQWPDDFSTPQPEHVHSTDYLTLASEVVSKGEPIEIQWHNLPGNDRDWIAVVPADASDRTWGNHWWYTEGAQTGMRTIELEEAGEYEIRVYFNWPEGSYQVHSRLRLQVR